MKALLNDLRLRDRRELLKDILENAVPVTLQDVVIVFVTVSGMQQRPARAGDLRQQDLRGARRRARAQRHPDHDRGRHLRRARPAARRHAPRSGLIKQEQIASRSSPTASAALRDPLRGVECGLSAAGLYEVGDVAERGRAAARRYAERADGVAVSGLGVQLQRDRHP